MNKLISGPARTIFRHSWIAGWPTPDGATVTVTAKVGDGCVSLFWERDDLIAKGVSATQLTLRSEDFQAITAAVAEHAARPTVEEFHAAVLAAHADPQSVSVAADLAQAIATADAARTAFEEADARVARLILDAQEQGWPRVQIDAALRGSTYDRDGEGRSTCIG